MIDHTKKKNKKTKNYFIRKTDNEGEGNKEGGKALFVYDKILCIHCPLFVVFIGL